MSTDYIPSYDTLKDAITKSITLPCGKGIDDELEYDVVSDAFILSCGCILSKKFAIALSSNSKLICPICQSSSSLGYDLKPLQNLYFVLFPKKIAEQDKKESLLSLFYSVANSVNENESKSQQISTNSTNSITNFNKPIRQFTLPSPSFSKSASSDSSSTNDTIPLSTGIRKLSTHSVSSSPQVPKPQSFTSSSITNQSFASSTSSSIPIIPPPPAPAPPSSSSSSSTAENQQEQKEYLFVKCFPTYRRQFKYNTHSKFLKTKSKIFINNSISPGAKYFALLSPKKWEVYKINEDSKQPPTLTYCGKATGEYGANFENLNKAPIDEIIGGSFVKDEQLIKKKLNDWEHLYCSISDDYLVISGTNGIFRVIDLNNGKPIYLYISNFPIRCIQISSNSTLIAYGITGKDRILGTEQALVVLHKLNIIKSSQITSSSSYESSSYESIFANEPITITFPYRDPINNLSFSPDSNYLSCSTALESRFLTVWVKNYTEPKLVMKSIRSLDTSLESEGITDLKMFPNNKYMIISSMAFNAPPIIIDNNISSINGLQTVAQPKMLLKLDEIGSSIHKSTISPRNDTLAILDRNGTVYLIFATKMDKESKRIFIVDQVSNAFRMRESASLQFSKDGHKLYILDRKGIFYINDFAAGLPQMSDITRCKPLLWGV